MSGSTIGPTLEIVCKHEHAQAKVFAAKLSYLTTNTGRIAQTLASFQILTHREVTCTDAEALFKAISKA
jgi:hypothetical protein